MMHESLALFLSSLTINLRKFSQKLQIDCFEAPYILANDDLKNKMYASDESWNILKSAFKKMKKLSFEKDESVILDKIFWDFSMQSNGMKWAAVENILSVGIYVLINVCMIEIWQNLQFWG